MTSPPPTEGASRIDRRTALRLGGGGALAIVIAGGAGWLDRRGADTLDAGPPTTSTTTSTSTTTTTTTAAPEPVEIPDVGAVDPRIATLGERVLATTGDDDLEALLRSLPDGGDDPLARAAAVVRDEFRRGDTLIVDGWVLARSEATAAAVIALLCRDASC